MSLGYYGRKDRKLLEEMEEHLEALSSQRLTELAILKKTNDFLDQIQKALEISADFQEQILAAILALQTPGGKKPAVALRFSLGVASNQ